MTLPLSAAELAPITFSRYSQLDDIAYDIFERTLERGPAAKRVMWVAKQKFATRAEQMNAITLALQEELASADTQTTAEKNLDAFRGDAQGRSTIEAGAPIPALEDGRPHWSDREHDADRWHPDNTTATPSEMSWHTAPVPVPVSTYYGIWDRGTFRSAKITLDLRQTTTAAEPRIAFERHAWTSKGEPIVGDLHYTLKVSEAAELARALLLLVDLAIETDEIAESK